MKQYPPAVQLAIRFLQVYVNRLPGNAEGRLPSIQRLATMAHVSLVTMWKAVHALHDDGMLGVIHGQGIHVVGLPKRRGTAQPESAIDDIHIRRNKCVLIKRLLYRDILNGVYPADHDLPLLKQLTTAYGASSNTLRKALQVLVEEGVILPGKRTYKVAPLASQNLNTSVAVFSRGSLFGEISSWTPWSKDFLRILEHICAQVNVKLIPYTYTKDERGELVFLSPNGVPSADIAVDDTTIAFLVRSASEDGLHLNLLHKLAQYDKYIAVSDEGSCRELPLSITNNRKVRLFTVDPSTYTGREIGRFLLELGHKHVAYFSPSHSALWSQHRLNGLVETYKEAGAGHDVVSYTRDDFPLPFWYEDKVADVELVKQTLLSMVPGVTEKTCCDEGLIQMMRHHLVQIAQEEQLRTCLLPWFQDATQKPEITTWVCAADRVANIAWRYLEVHADTDRKKEIDIVGCDDTFESFEHGYCSYNFNIPALVQAMISYVLYPERGLARQTGQKPVHIGGTMIQRNIRDLRKRSAWAKSSRL